MKCEIIKAVKKNKIKEQKLNASNSGRSFNLAIFTIQLLTFNID